MLDQDQIRLGQTVYKDSAKDHSDKALNRLQSKIGRLPEVMHCYRLTGDYDFLIQIVTKDMQAYHQSPDDSVVQDRPVAKVDSRW